MKPAASGGAGFETFNHTLAFRMQDRPAKTLPRQGSELPLGAITTTCGRTNPRTTSRYDSPPPANCRRSPRLDRPTGARYYASRYSAASCSIITEKPHKNLLPKEFGPGTTFWASSGIARITRYSLGPVHPHGRFPWDVEPAPSSAPRADEVNTLPATPPKTPLQNKRMCQGYQERQGRSPRK